MKAERWLTAAQGAVLAFLMAFGATGVMRTAFGLECSHYGRFLWTLVGASLLWAGVFSLKYGGWMGMLAAAAGCLRLAATETFARQLGQLIFRISYVYDCAYDWGYLPLGYLPWDAGVFDLPMGAAGVALAGLTAWAVCRGGSLWPPLTGAFLLLAPCFVVTDTVPGEMYVFLLFFAAVILLLTAEVRGQDARQGNRLTLLVAAPVALALLGLFLAVPREGYVDRSAQLREKLLSLWEQGQEAGDFGPELPSPELPEAEPERVDLAALGPREEPEEVVMTVTAQWGGALYLRGQDRDRYDGTGWTSSSHRAEGFGYAGVDLGTVAVETSGVLEQVYLPYYPAGGQSLIEGVYRNTRLAEGYTFRRLGLPGDWQALARSWQGENLPEELSHYLTLPETTRAGVREILENILPEGASVAEQAQIIRDFVRNCAQYDLEPDRMGAEEGDFALWFINEAERGYCVHFATTAAVLLRGAGIGARYVTGYLLPVEAGERAAVTGKHAHAWAEYYEPALNTWIPLEATPGQAEDTDEGMPQTQPTLPPETEGLEETAPQTLPTASQTAPVEETLPPAAGSGGGSWAWLWWLLTGPALAGALEGQRWLRIRLGAYGRSCGGANQRCLKCWRQAEKLSRILGEDPPAHLEMLANKAKFSRHTITEEELKEFDAYRALVRAKLARKGRLRRIFCRYVYGI